MAYIAAEYVIYILGCMAFGVVLWRARSVYARVEAVRTLVAAVAGSYALKWIMGILWFRSRPFVVFRAIHALVQESVTSHSFPSGHATVSAALATVLYTYDKQWGKWAWALAVVVAFGRVAVGVHYFSDVITGLAVGFLVSQLVIRYSKS